MSSLANYFHTLRHLRPVQLFGRARFKLYRPPPDERSPPPLRAAVNPYAAPISAAQSMVGADRFRFLNVEANCTDAADWQGHGRTLLWTYNLHYFDDLNAEGAGARRVWHAALMQRWIDENPPAAGIGWDPYPVSRRLVNWIKWALAGNELSPAACHSLAVQTRWLTRRIEFHLQGNHVFANAKALVHGGLFFQGQEAGRWLARGLSLMQSEMTEQVLADGGHFERSPMYHAAFAEDILDTLGLMHAYGYEVDPAWGKTAARMISWLEAMSHPDTGLAFFNDAAFGIAPAAAQLRAYATRLNLDLEPIIGAGLHRMMPSGYVRVDLPPFFLICDVAPVGPEHLPAHAHADTLSFELSFKRRRVFVNSGVSEYGRGAERQRQRGTAAHNTLVVDDEDSSEVWAGFRVARRSRARLLHAKAEGPAFRVVGEHDGYRRLHGRNLHRRSWRLTPQQLLVEDAVHGRFRSAICYFHLHPEIKVQSGSGSTLLLSDPHGPLLDMGFEGAGSVEVFDSTWHPEFGVSVAARCIAVRLEGPRLLTLIRRSDSN